MRGAVLVLLLSGCSSEPAPPDLSVGAPDLSAAPGSGCMFVLGGDASGMDLCTPMLCRLSASDTLLRIYDGRISGSVGFIVSGEFTAGHTYTVADLKSFEGSAKTGLSARYAAGNAFAGSTATLTLTEVDPSPPNCMGRGTVHGTSHTELIESLSDDGGTRTPGRITIDAVF